MVKLVLTFKRRPDMSLQEFVDYRRDVHAPLLFAIPEARLIRRFVVSHPVPDAGGTEAAFDAVVEAWFDTRSEVDALYSSENFITEVDPDHVNFIDLTTVARAVCEETVVR